MLLRPGVGFTSVLRALAFFFSAIFPAFALAATFTVTNTNNSGAGSLRQAILDANGNVSPPHTINFNIVGTGPFVISLSSALPAVTRRTAIDASGEAINGAPGVRISGLGLPASTVGLTFESTAASSSLSYLSITEFPGHGVSISSEFTIVTNCYIGIGTDGNTDLGNGQSGVRVLAANVSIGTNTTTGNVISGNTQHGVRIEAGADSSKIYGNKIGTNAAGTAAVPNGAQGIYGSGSTGVFVGSSLLPNTGNLISGNGAAGIRLESTSQGWFINANLIGTTADGTAVLSNAYGMRIFSDGHFIGSNLAAGRNVISGNTTYGIELFNGADGNSIYGNYIGTNSTGTAGLGVQPTGIRTVTGAMNGLTIGGDGTAGYRNVISGNLNSGIAIESGSAGVVIAGNYIGTNAAGTASIGNGTLGVGVSITGAGNLVGGNTAAARNVISGNGQYGIVVGGTGVLISGNYIGPNAAGTAAISNQSYGIRAITASGAIIGGTTAAHGNVISGNQVDGVALDGDTDAITLSANIIGLNPGGTSILGNGATGVSIAGTNHVIGGITTAERNIISGNGVNGLVVDGSGTVAYGNHIGVNAAGLSAFPNAQYGIALYGSNNTVGSNTAGHRNLISGNGSNGILFSGSGNVVQGNYIGTNITGSVGLGNGGYGVRIYDASGGELGGDAVAKGNVISGNERSVSLELDTTGVVIRNNIIGLSADMTAKLPSNGSGIELSADGNTIGGPGAGNVIAGTAYDGIGLSGLATGNIIQGNWIGTNKNLAPDLGNRFAGIFITDAYDNLIGGTGANEGNIISNNGFMGVQIQRGDNNALIRNSIHSNSLLGIDLGEQYVFPNDLQDIDIVGNRQMNYPLLNSVVVSGPNTQFEGRIYNEPDSQYTLEFFSSPDCDETGMGEGKTYLGSDTVLTDGTGLGTIVSTLNLVVADSFASATVTDAQGNTSEFSPCALVGGENPGQLQFFRSVYLAYEGNVPTAEVIITRSHGLAGTVTANFTISDNTATAGSDYTDVDQVVTFLPWEVVKVIEVPILVDPATELPDPENALLALSAPTGGATLGLASSEVLIFDQDKAWPGITISDASITEGNSGQKTLSFNVNLTATDHPVTVGYLAESGTAILGEDFLDSEDILEFGISDDTQTLQATVEILGDTDVESDEIVWMRITVAEDGGNWIAYDTYGQGLIINDDGIDPPPEMLFKDGFEDP